jgi:hypothetical protein
MYDNGACLDTLTVNWLMACSWGCLDPLDSWWLHLDVGFELLAPISSPPTS